MTLTNLSISSEERRNFAFQYWFKRNYEITSRSRKGFAETFSSIISDLKTTRTEFSERTGFSPSTFDKWKTEPESISMKYIVIFALVYELDLLVVATLLRAGGFDFNLSKERDYAYAYLIMHPPEVKRNEFRTESEKCEVLIKKCNKILHDLGLPRMDYLSRYGENADDNFDDFS